MSEYRPPLPVADLLTMVQLQELIHFLRDIQDKDDPHRRAELQEFFRKFRDQLNEKGVDSDYLAHYVNQNYFKYR